MIRVFKLPSGPNDYAVAATADYVASVAARKLESQSSGVKEQLLRVFDWFCSRLLPQCTELMATHQQVVRLVEGNGSR